ncbi:MAG: hypothetical protein RBU30_08635 [Polyangia bacterium]|nr:hypothetical protein [Polyangia bacterium]
MEDKVRLVVAVLDESGARWALVGAHAVGILTTPRATVDVDLLVEERKLSAVVRSLEHSLGPLEKEDIGPALRLKGLDVDLIRSNNHPLFSAVLEHVLRVEGWNLPRPEALIALKFLAAVSPWRGQEKKLHDAGDLVSLYRNLRDDLDPELLTRLSGLVYPGAEKELLGLLDRVDSGEPLTI